MNNRDGADERNEREKGDKSFETESNPPAGN